MSELRSSSSSPSPLSSLLPRLNMLENNNSNKLETIGFSEEGEALTVKYLNVGGNDELAHPLKIFLLAGQHGDESYGRKAVNKLINTLESGSAIDKSISLRLAILSNANPDGSSLKRRTNALGIDLNRDHLFLKAAETRAIHSFVREWKPHLIVDIHNYPSRRKHLLQKGIVMHHDVLIDIPTNPSTVFANNQFNQNKLTELIQTVKKDLLSAGFSCERYFVIKPSWRARHSTPDIVDSRNFLALRYNTMTILLEGRMPTHDDGKVEREHLKSAQLSALLSILAWAYQNKEYLFETRKYLQTMGQKIGIRSKYIVSKQPFNMSFRNTCLNNISAISLSKYRPYLKLTKHITLPSAYAIPKDKDKIIDLLHRHGFVSHNNNGSGSNDLQMKEIQFYYIHSVSYSNRENRPPKKITLTVQSDKRKLDDYQIFDVEQTGGHSLSIMLEPESKYGLHRNRSLDLPIIPNFYYPVLRVI